MGSSLGTSAGVVYACDTCKRSVRVAKNDYGLEVVGRCIITGDCVGRMVRSANRADLNYVQLVPPSVLGLQDWRQRRVFYKHEQRLESSVWEIKHNLTNSVSVELFVTKNSDLSGVVEVVPVSVEVVDDNTIRIVLNDAYLGIAHCVTTSSPNRSAVVAAPIVSTDLLLTNMGEITIATPISRGTGVASLVFTGGTGGTPLTVVYNRISNKPVIESPWSDSSVVSIAGSQYLVRSFNVVTTPQGPTYFSRNMITDGGSCVFGGISTRGELLILLGTYPFTNADKTVNAFIDAADLSANPMYFKAGDLYVSSSLSRTVYPHILTVA